MDDKTREFLDDTTLPALVSRLKLTESRRADEIQNFGPDDENAAALGHLVARIEWVSSAMKDILAHLLGINKIAGYALIAPMSCNSTFVAVGRALKHAPEGLQEDLALLVKSASAANEIRNRVVHSMWTVSIRIKQNRKTAELEPEVFGLGEMKALSDRYRLLLYAAGHILQTFREAAGMS